MRGAFITLEGTEGVGKSTNLAVVERGLVTAGLDVVVTREPGGTALGEVIRQWILDRENGPVSAQVEILLMFAARAQHLEQVIRPALSRGQWVVCDRYTDATVAYQGGGRCGDRRLIETLRTSVQGGLEPDLTLLFDAPVDIGLGRIAGRETDRFEQEQREFFERVRTAYLELAEREPGRIELIDAAEPPARVAEQVTRVVGAFIERWR